jgi:adhesin/invasin
MVPHRFPLSFRRFALVAAAALVVAGACEKMPLVAPSGTVITLISGTNALPSNGSTDITAVLIENGTAPSTGTGGQAAAPVAAGTPVHNGTLVTFTTTLGRIEPVEARTTAGRATVKLVGDGRSGVATITAISGGASRTLTVNVGAAAAVRILMTANPQALPATGGTSTISARVEDGQGNGLQGVPIAFSTTAGTLANGTVVSDANGVATTTLTTTADATVTGSAGGGSTTPSTLTGTVAIKLNANLALSLTPQSGTVTVSTPMTFSVSVGATPVVTGVRLNFGDGESIDLGPISAAQTVSHVYGATGAYTANATATVADGTTKTVNAPIFVNDYSVTLTSSGNAVFGATSTFTAAVSPTGVSISGYIFDFGDGTIQTTSSPSITHTFQSRGTKTVKVTVVPTKGPAHEAVVQLEIS